MREQPVDSLNNALDTHNWRLSQKVGPTASKFFSSAYQAINLKTAQKHFQTGDSILPGRVAHNLGNNALSSVTTMGVEVFHTMLRLSKQ
ncbi:MAG: hypothetical protein VYC39_09130, partial [Myxococcota bacterium]|nr:hypothetical protein [Myxococcota bacterium]